MARDKAYHHAKFCHDPSNRLATIHQRHRQDRQTDRETDNGPIAQGELFYKRSLKKWTDFSFNVMYRPSVYINHGPISHFANELSQLLQQQQQPFYGRLPGTTQVSRYQKKHSPTHHPDHHPIVISFFHLPRSIASSLFKLRAWQSFCTTSFHVLFGLPLSLKRSTSYSIHFFTQSVSSFRSTCPYHHNLFCCSINIISSIPSLSLNSLL